jgi:hypothetical protein
MEQWKRSFAFQTLYPRESVPVSIGQETGWAPETIWMLYKTEKFLGVPGIEI